MMMVIVITIHPVGDMNVCLVIHPIAVDIFHFKIIRLIKGSETLLNQKRSVYSVN